MYSGWLPETRLRAALLKQRSTKRPLGETLVDFGFLPEEAVVRALAIQWNVPVGDLEGMPKPPPDVLAAMTRERAEQFVCVPIAAKGRIADVVVCDGRAEHLSNLRLALQKDVHPYLASARAVKEAIKKWYDVPHGARSGST